MDCVLLVTLPFPLAGKANLLLSFSGFLLSTCRSQAHYSELGTEVKKPQPKHLKNGSEAFMEQWIVTLLRRCVAKKIQIEQVHNSMQDFSENL